MPDKPPRPLPASGDRAQAEREARLAREAAALRENLRRRKQQMRAREDAPEDAEPTTAPPGDEPA